MIHKSHFQSTKRRQRIGSNHASKLSSIMILSTSTIWIVILSATMMIMKVEGAHSARRPSRVSSLMSSSYSDAKYDRSITTFSSDGRLLQVEYGMEASNKGQSVACLELDWMNVTSTNLYLSGSKYQKKRRHSFSAICVAIVVEEGEPSLPHDSTTTTTTTTTKLEEKEVGTIAKAEKIHRIDNHCLLITTGLIGDGKALAQMARTSCQRMRLTYGETPTLNEISQQVSQIQHQLTRTAGARPFGVTATILGVDPYPTDNHDNNEERDIFTHDLFVNHDDDDVTNGKDDYSTNVYETEDSDEEEDDLVEDDLGKPRLFQSEPGGIVEEYHACAAGKARTKLESQLMQLRQSLMEKANDMVTTLHTNNAHNSDDDDDYDIDDHLKSNLLGEMVKGVAQTMFDTEETNAKRLDIWVVESDVECRGGTRIRCAKYVARNDLDRVQRIFANDEH